MACFIKGVEGCQNAPKQIWVTNFRQTCSLISIYTGMYTVVMMHLSEQVRLVEL